MAKDKKSFVLYADLIHTVKKMSREDAGELLLHILKYVNDENPETDNLYVDLTFEPIKQQFKRDLRKWENTIEYKSKGGRIGNIKRWNLDLYDKIISKELTLEEAEVIAENRKTSHSDKNDRIPSHSIANVAVTVNDNVNVNDTVTVIKKKEDIVARKLKFSSTLQPFLETYGKEFLNDFYKYWTEPNKSNSKFKQELEKTWDLERRLGTWAKNDKNFNKSENGNKTSFNGDNTKKQFVYNRDDALKALSGKT